MKNNTSKSVLFKSSSKPGDQLVRSYDHFDDSVYECAWSYADPWIFASLSYDGKVAVDFVPKSEKYKILL
jgi:WD40 repeat protein